MRVKSESTILETEKIRLIDKDALENRTKGLSDSIIEGSILYNYKIIRKKELLD